MAVSKKLQVTTSMILRSRAINTQWTSGHINVWYNILSAGKCQRDRKRIETNETNETGTTFRMHRESISVMLPLKDPEGISQFKCFGIHY